MDYLPRGLLARAAFFRETKAYALARKDLDAVASGMRLFECDAHLEYARLALAEGRPDEARTQLKSAASLASECGYGRRKGEIAALEAALA